MSSTALLRMIPTENHIGQSLLKQYKGLISIKNQSLFKQCNDLISIKKQSLFKKSSKFTSTFRTCAHHWIGNNIDCVPNVENFEVFKFFCLVFPHNIHLSQSLINAVGEIFMKSWNLTVSDFCNSSSSSGRKQRVELAGPSHSGRDISSTLKENFVFGLNISK